MKKLLLVGLILLTVLITGCWDMIEINHRLFPYVVGIDLNDKGDDKFKFIFSYPNINALGKSPTQEDRIHIISAIGNSGFEAVHHLGSSLKDPLYTKLLKVVIISEEVAKDEDLIRQIADGINRDFIINKRIQMVVVKESAEGFIQNSADATRQETVEGSIYGLLVNEQNSSSFTPKVVTEFIRDMDKSKASIVPLGKSQEGDLEISGGAIFKNYMIVGYIDHMENRAIGILNNEIKQDGLYGEYKGSNLTVLGTSFKTKRKLIEAKEIINILYSVKIEGQLHEYTLLDDDFIDTDEVIEGMEKSLEDVLKMDLEMAVEKLQKVHKADVLHIGDYLSKFHPKLWKQVEEDWEEIFPDIQISVEVDVKIRRRGLTK